MEIIGDYMQTGKLLILTAVAVFSSGNMFANELSYSYITSGSFGGPHPDLDITAQFREITGTTVAGAASNLPLGVFSLHKANDVDTYTNLSFTLDVTFTLPTGNDGGGTSVFYALLNGVINGTIKKQGNGSLNLDFNPGSKDFTFHNALNEGLFTFSVANLDNMRWNQSTDERQGNYELIGSISRATDFAPPTDVVPEPSSFLLLATAVCGTAIGLRRKAKS
jgi:PEP-CTERM motif